MKKIVCLIVAVSTFSGASLFALQDPSFSQKKSNPIFPSKISSPEQSSISSFNYTSIGIALPIPIPAVAIGHRQKFDDSAIDFSAGLATAIIASGISANCIYIKYLNKDNFYLSGGAGFGLAFLVHVPVTYGLFPSIGIGKENEKSFHQVNANLVSFTIHGVRFFPCLSYEYGFKY